MRKSRPARLIIWRRWLCWAAEWGWGGGGLTVRGAARGAVAGAVAHLDPLPAHLQQARVGHARFARVAEALLVVAAVVGDVDGGPGRPGRGLLHVGAGQGVARLVLLQQRNRNETQIDFSFPPSALRLQNPSSPPRGAAPLPSARADNRERVLDGRN